jgi:hypothetical protein
MNSFFCLLGSCNTQFSLLTYLSPLLSPFCLVSILLYIFFAPLNADFTYSCIQVSSVTELLNHGCTQEKLFKLQIPRYTPNYSDLLDLGVTWMLESF